MASTLILLFLAVVSARHERQFNALELEASPVTYGAAVFLKNFYGPSNFLYWLYGADGKTPLQSTACVGGDNGGIQVATHWESAGVDPRLTWNVQPWGFTSFLDTHERQYGEAPPPPPDTYGNHPATNTYGSKAASTTSAPSTTTTTSAPASTTSAPSTSAPSTSAPSTTTTSAPTTIGLSATSAPPTAIPFTSNPQCIKIGDAVEIVNPSASGGYTYLDACAASTCAGVYSVQLSSHVRVATYTTSKWTVVDASGTKAAGSCVNFGDQIYLLNAYNAGSYLDTCNPQYFANGTQGGYYVQTAARPTRDQTSGTWAFVQPFASPPPPTTPATTTPPSTTTTTTTTTTAPVTTAAPTCSKTIQYYTKIVLENGYGPHTYLFNLGSASGCAGGQKLATAWLNNTANANVGQWMLYTWDPTAPSKVFPAGTCVKYGDAVAIGYLGTGGGWLDVCGVSTCTDGYAVQISSSDNRDHSAGTSSGLWTVFSASKAIGTCVCEGDTVYFKNGYAAGTYLDTCNPYYSAAGVDAGYYVQSTSKGPTRDGPSGSWTLRTVAPVAPTCNTIQYYTNVALQNGYGPGTYLFNLGTATGCASGQKLATSWLNNTANANVGSWMLYTWDPTAPSQVFPAGTCVKYGDAVAIRYQGASSGGWLDVCGVSTCTDGYAVQISSSDNRDHSAGTSSGLWTVFSATKAIGTCVCDTDVVYFKNGYASGTYLDTCNPYYAAGGVDAGYYVQSTGKGPTRDGPSGSWTIKTLAPPAPTCKPIQYYTNLAIQNGYGPGTYLFNLGTNTGCAGGSKLATVWLNNTANANLGLWTLYTWDPTAPSKVFPAGTCVKYGDALAIGYQGSGGGYLDVCGVSTCTDGYAVQISSGDNRDHSAGTSSGLWTVFSATKAIGTCVCEGDVVYFKNGYAAGTYLDTCNPYYAAGGVDAGYYVQSTGKGPTRDGPSGSWTLHAH